MKGLIMAAGGALVGLLLFGVRDVAGYGATFALALPGFAYGWFQPEGKPVEYWLRVVLRYYLTPQQYGAVRSVPTWRQRLSKAALMIRAALRARRMARRQRRRRSV